MQRSWWNSTVAAALFAAPAFGQTPGFRLTYGVRVVARDGGDAYPVATGTVSGPQDTNLRLALRTDTAEVEALFDVFPEPGAAPAARIAGCRCGRWTATGATRDSPGVALRGCTRSAPGAASGAACSGSRSP